MLVDVRFYFVFHDSDLADKDQYMGWLHLMTDVYREMLRGGSMSVQGDALPSLNELTEVCRTLYQINFIATMYVSAWLRSLDLRGGDEAPATALISRLKQQRLVRPFSRCQILSNAWVATRRIQHWTTKDTAAISNSSTHQSESLSLFGALEPWELQHVDHAEPVPIPRAPLSPDGRRSPGDLTP